MGAYFVSPLPFTVISSVTDAGSNPNSMNNDYSSMTWRSSTATAMRFVIDLGPNPVAWDFVCLNGCNFKSTDTVQFRSGTDTTGTGAFSGGGWIPSYTGFVAPTMKSKHFRRFGAVRTERYIRIDIQSTADAGYIEVSRLIIGKAISVLGLEKRAEPGVLDSSLIESGPGYEEYDAYPAVQKWKFSCPVVTADSYWTEWYPMILERGTTKGVFMCADDTSAYPQMTTLYGRFSQLPAPKIINNVNYALDATITAFAP